MSSRHAEFRQDARRYWAWIALGAAAIALWVAWLLLPVGEWAEAFRHWILGFGYAGVGVFAAVFIAATLVLAPDWPLAVVAGMVYGIGAIVIVLAAAMVAASLAFLLARYFLRQRVEAIASRQRKFAAIDRAVCEEGWRIVILLRLSPLVPFNVQNYLFGATAIPFEQYAAATFIGIIPGTSLFVYLGTLGHGSAGPLEWGFFAAGLAATAILAILVTRRAKARLAEAAVRDQLP